MHLKSQMYTYTVYMFMNKLTNFISEVAVMAHKRSQELPRAQGQGQRLCFVEAAVKRDPTSKVIQTQVRR